MSARAPFRRPASTLALRLALGVALAALLASFGCGKSPDWLKWPFGGDPSAPRAAAPDRTVRTDRTDRADRAFQTDRAPDLSGYAFLLLTVEAAPSAALSENDLSRLAGAFLAALAETPLKRLALVEQAVETPAGRTTDVTLSVVRRERLSGVAAPLGQTSDAYVVAGRVSVADALDGRALGGYALESSVASGGPFPQADFAQAERDFVRAAVKALSGP